jgi:pyruvate dehydrogenase E2 component (dihydrolipoyllysine-residue acetyltransferase)
MAESIIMPKTGMSMEEGTIIEWMVKEGDVVSVGDPVAEIETDKSTMELESDYSGTIIKIVHQDGETVPVIKTIAWIGEKGEAIPEEIAAEDKAEVKKVEADSISSASQQSDPGMASDIDGRFKATPAARRVASERGVSLSSIQPSGRFGEIREKDVLDLKITKSTPLAQRMAEDQGIDLSAVKGSGHNGKIFTSDLNTSRAGQAGTTPVGEDQRVPLTKIQKITGKRMFQSHSEIPVVSMDTKADVSELMKIRKQLNETLDCRITINDFVLRATALALEENPRINSVLDGDDLIYKSGINLSMAVATKKGLLVPVVRNANILSLRQLSKEAAAIAQRGRDGKLGPDEMEGGTFTVSNIGMYGISSFTPIINQPQAAILGVCAISDKLIMKEGQIESIKEMGLSLTFDHRIVDGAEASIFFSRIRDLLEKPLAILA